MRHVRCGCPVGYPGCVRARTRRCFPLNCFSSFFLRALVASSSSSVARNFLGTCSAQCTVHGGAERGGVESAGVLIR